MLLSLTALSSVCRELRLQNMTIVFTNGCFDILHAGHVSYLTQASQLGDILVVGVNSDSSVRRLKGPTRPVNSVWDRITVLNSLRAVDYTCIFDADTPLELIQSVVPHILVKGGDYEKNNVVGADFVEHQGGKVVLLPYLEGKSTSNIIQSIFQQTENPSKNG